MGPMTNTRKPKTYAQRQADKARRDSAAEYRRRQLGIRTYTGTFAEQQAAMAADREKARQQREWDAAQRAAKAARVLTPAEIASRETRLEPVGECAGCDRIREGNEMHFPRHAPSSRCESGSRPHCTCDTCW